MNYESEGEYNAAMSAQGEAEAEYQARADYEQYLDELYQSGKHYQWALHVASDELSSRHFKESGKSAVEYLHHLITESNKPIEYNGSMDDLPF